MLVSKAEAFEVETVKQKREAGMPSSLYRRAGRPCVGGVAMLS
jgi:hypothetical protein